MKIKKLTDLSTLVSLAKRRGFVFQSSEVYGGLNSCWDYGPLGAQLKLNIKTAWWNAMTRRRDVVGLDAAILMHPRVWEASGHVAGFSDPLVDCKKCKQRFREDTNKVNNQVVCPACGSTDVTESRAFNLMFQTHMGPVADEGSLVYLRPETAQGIFVNFENVQTSTRKKLPFGIAQIGKSFRNEITPGNFIFRTREFEQMEMQYFVRPGTDAEHFAAWKALRWQFYLDLGLAAADLRFRDHGPDELAHYASAAVDIQFQFPFGWQELEGIHNRGDFDLKQHQEFSGKKLEYFDEAAGTKYLPYVVETAAGCDRLCLAVMSAAYREEETVNDKGDTDVRVVMGLAASLAPVKLACLPLSKKPELQSVAQQLADDMSRYWQVEYDDAGSIGKRYRRQDEVGTPFCVTIDFDTVHDQAVTIRLRDSMKQERVNLSQVKAFIDQNLI